MNKQLKINVVMVALLASSLLFAHSLFAMTSESASAPHQFSSPTFAKTTNTSTRQSTASATATISVENLVTFYTTYGYEVGQDWHIPFQLWVSERPDVARRLIGAAARSVLSDKAGLETLSEQQRGRYETVVEGFIADSESREAITIVFSDDPANERFELTDNQGNTKTDRNGNLQGKVVISFARAEALLKAQASTDGWLSFNVVSDDQAGVGHVRLIPPIGTSIISDIDDTIKDTGITQSHEIVLRNTFFEAFKQVPCMANLYSSVDSSVAFHYVSGAPWQLYTPLSEFLFDSDHGYPLGSMHMKNVRTNLTESSSYSDLWTLMSQGSQQATLEQKIGQITQLLTNFPIRQFVLIGDSGERDPEVFSEIRKRFPAHIERIVIRDLGSQSDEDNERFNEMYIINGDANPDSGCPARELIMP